MSAPKRARYTEEPVFLNTGGGEEPYIPVNITSARAAYAASLHLLFKHVADFHILMVDIIAEKYKLDTAEIIHVCHEDKRFQQMVVAPTIHSLGYFNQEDLSAKREVEQQPDPVDQLVGETAKLSLGVSDPKPKKKVIRKKVAPAPQ
jgi:hypothetical protein